MRFMPLTLAETCNVYWALRMNSKSAWVPVASVAISSRANKTLAIV